MPHMTRHKYDSRHTRFTNGTYAPAHAKQRFVPSNIILAQAAELPKNDIIDVFATLFAT